MSPVMEFKVLALALRHKERHITFECKDRPVFFPYMELFGGLVKKKTVT